MLKNFIIHLQFILVISKLWLNCNFHYFSFCILIFIFLECNCLVHNEIIKFKHPGVQQEILDRLISKNWRLLINPTLVFNQCLETNLRPFFWDKTDDYSNYTLVRTLYIILI